MNRARTVPAQAFVPAVPSPTSRLLLRIHFDRLRNLLKHLPEEVDRGSGQAHDHPVDEHCKLKPRAACQGLGNNCGVQNDHEGSRPESMTNYAVRSDPLAVFANFEQNVGSEVCADDIPLLCQHSDNRTQREMHVLPFSRVHCGSRVPLPVRSKNIPRLDSLGNSSNAPSAAGTMASVLIKSIRRNLRSRVARSSSLPIPSSILSRTTRSVATRMAATATGGLASLCDATPRVNNVSPKQRSRS